MEPLLTPATLQHLQVPATKRKTEQVTILVHYVILRFLETCVCRLLYLCFKKSNVLLTLLGLHSSNNTAACLFCGPGPTPVDPGRMGRIGARPCAGAAAAAESL